MFKGWVFSAQSINIEVNLSSLKLLDYDYILNYVQLSSRHELIKGVENYKERLEREEISLD